MRADGASFPLEFKPTAGNTSPSNPPAGAVFRLLSSVHVVCCDAVSWSLAGFTYNFTATLRGANGTASQSAAHLRLSIYPPESITTAGDGSNGCDLPPGFSGQAHDVGEISLGAFAAAAGGRQSWGESKCSSGVDSACCTDPTRVGPASEPCGGTYRHFPGQDFGSSGRCYLSTLVTSHASFVFVSHRID